MKRVLVANPAGARLYELTDGEYDRLEYLLELAEPAERRIWTIRFLAERQPSQVFPPGASGAEVVTDFDIDRAISGNFFTSKWGRIRGGRNAFPGAS